MAANKNKRKLRAPKVADSELSRVVTDIYDELNKLSGGLSDATEQRIKITTISQSDLPLNPVFQTVTANTFTGDLTGNVTGNVTGDVTGDLTGAIHVQGKNETGGTLTKGTPVYISGQVANGQQFTIGVADSNGSGTMPSIGILSADVNDNAMGDVVTHGKLIGIDTSSFTVGDELYISDSGTLTATPPTGESNLLQKIAKVIRVDATDGQVYIMGAGRTNAVPNLDQGAVFIGDANNQAVASTFSIVNEASPSGGGSLAYSNGTFTFTPANVSDLTGYIETISTSATSGLSSNESNGTVTMSLDVNALTAETTVSSGDFLALSQSGNTKKVALSNIDLSLLDNSTSGFIDDYTVTQGDVTQHQAALSITESQISDLQTYLTAHPTIGGNAVNQDNSGNSFIQDLTFDTNGHVTAVTSATASFTDTNYYLNGANWATGTGVLTLNVLGASDVTVNLDGRYLTSLPSHNHNDLYYTESEVDGFLSGKDNYQSWTISDSTSPTPNSEAITSGSTLKFAGGGATTVAYNPSNNIMTISSTDTNTDTNSFVSAGSYNASTKDLTLTITGQTDPVIDLTAIDADKLDGQEGSYYKNYNNLDNKPAVIVDSDFTTAGFMKTDGSGTYSVDGSTYLTSVSLSDVTQHLSVVTQSATGGGELSLVNGEFRFKPAAVSSFIALTDISVGTNAPASGSGGLAYSNTNGTFTYTPPDLSSYLTAHPSISAASSVDNSGVSVIQDVTLDGNGHVTGLTSKDLANEFVPNNANLVVQASASGGGSLTYDTSAKQFTYTPPAAATGDITEIKTNTNSGLNGGTTSGVATLSFNISNLVDMTEDVEDIDEIAILDGITNKRKALSEIDISVFNNDSNFTSNTGDITEVTAGDGLSGGGTSGAVTLSHSDTSSQASVNNSNGSVIQDVTLDTYGHVTSLTSVDLDSRYLELSGGILTGDTKLRGGDLFLDAAAVNGTGNRRIRFTEGSSTSAGFQGGYIYYDGDANKLHLGMHDATDSNTANDLDAITILRSNQNVGIGTASPETKLHVESTSSSTSPIITIENDDDIKLKLGTVRSAAGTGPNTSFIGYDGDLRFLADADGVTTVVTFDSGGDVDIANDLNIDGSFTNTNGNASWRKSGTEYTTTWIDDKTVKFVKSASSYAATTPYGEHQNFIATFSFKTSNATHLGLVYHGGVNPSDDGYSVIIRSSNTVRVQKRQTNVGQSYLIGGVNGTAISGVDIDDNNWHRVTVQVIGQKVRVDIDGNEIINGSHSDTTFTEGGVGYIAFDGTVEFNNLEVQEIPSTTFVDTLNLDGISEGATDTTALMWNQGRNVTYRTLGSNAFNSDTIPTASDFLPITGGTLVREITTTGIEYPLIVSGQDVGNNIDQGTGSGIGIKFEIAGNDTAGDSLVGASIVAMRESTTDSNSSTGLAFLVSQNDTTLDEAVRIDENGNVGIGTTSPNTLLHLSSTAPILTATSTNNSSGLRYNVNGTAQTVHRFQYGGSTLMTITNTGSVDIIGDLDVGGQLTISDSVASGVPLLVLDNDSNGNGATIEFNDNASDGQKGLLRYNHSDSLSQGGGASFHFTGEPDTVLVVGSDSNSGRFVASGNSASEVAYGFRGDVNTGMYSNTADYLKLATGGVDRLTIASSGSIGINYNTPSSQYGVHQFISSTNPDTDNRFAYFIDGSFSGADNTTADREQGGIYLDIDSSADGDASNEHRLRGIWCDVRHTGFSDIVHSGYFYAESNNTTESTSQLYGIQAFAVHDGGGSGGVNTLAGSASMAYCDDAGSLNAVFGAWNQVNVFSARGANNITTTTPTWSELELGASFSGTITHHYGVRSTIDNNSTSGATITNSYLFYGEIQGTDPATNKWGVYIPSSDRKNYFGGNVGIGTASPAQHISGTERVLHIQNSNVASINLDSTGSSGNTYVLSSTASGDFRVYDDDANSVRFLIDENGNVGIGETDPDQKLHVNSGTANFVAKFESTDDKASILLEDNDTLNYIHSQNGFMSLGGDSSLDVGNLNIHSTNGNVGIGSTNPSNTLVLRRASSGQTEHGLRLEYVEDAAPTQTSSSVLVGDYGLKFKNHNSGRDFLFETGNVGIGVNDPAVELEVGGSTNTQILISTTNNTGNSQIYFGDSDSDTAGVILYRHNGNSMAFEVNGGERMRIDSSGNVGIGTNNPVSLLHLENASSPSLRIKDTTNNVTLLAYAQDTNAHIGTYSNHDLIFDANSTEAMRINSSGSVDFADTVTVSDNVAGTFQALVLNNSRSSQDEVGNVSKLSFQHNSINAGEIRSVTTEDFTTSANQSARLEIHTVNNGTLSEAFRIQPDGTLDFTSTNHNIKMSRGGYITFYEDVNELHAIGSRDNSGNEADDLRINSYGAVYINLDSNNNNSSAADFLIGRHGSTGTISDNVFRVNGENKRVSAYGGVLFGTDTAAANTLDDYEEGTFTPQIHAGASNPSFNSNNFGKYTKIGNVVHCSGRFSVNSISAGSSGTSVELGGFPFAASTPLSSGTGAIAGSIGFASGFAGESPTMMQIRDNETNALLYYQNSSLGISNLKGNDFGTGAHSIVFQITYHTA